ncbi:hypothetical protein C0J52_06901 [Blattella germanica]|uniref:DNA methyltransferase 2 n=1 Tax=Blattella germanica TaxID=6973 RepID=A0A2P8Y5Q5_BLAGE|nr:hypothetical protein C0J52_06901 [Blattella germanica]QOI91607.1 DNA methyltransferase 2 [Blattella germanica]
MNSLNSSTIKVLELYSGIGGMNYALRGSGISGKVVAAMDINTTANKVYQHNFPDENLLQRNIQALTAEEINSYGIDMILMSPPCQPFTRVGLKKDVSDSRTCSFLHLLSIFPHLNSKWKYLLLENVKGFENSEACQLLLTTLEQINFCYQQFILSPSMFSVPNTRHRYYLIAKRRPLTFIFPVQLGVTDRALTYFEKFLINDKTLKKHAWLMDIVGPNSRRSCCFTKAYSHYVEGTGSVFCSKPTEIIAEVFKFNRNEEINPEQLQLLRSLELRYFTPQEVARLMCFPDDFSFPPDITIKQMYRLLGNSINVFVVTLLSPTDHNMQRDYAHIRDDRCITVHEITTKLAIEHSAVQEMNENFVPFGIPVY